MSYNLVNPTTGALTRVAGRGKAEYGASAIRTGTINIPSTAAGVQGTVTITFSAAMPDTDYVIVINNGEGSIASPNEWYTWSITEKSASGFKIRYLNVDNTTTSGVTKLTYTAFKLYSNIEINDLVNSMPSDASASNKLVTESDLPLKKIDISATGGATSFSATIPLSMAQRNKPFYLEVLSVGNNNAIKEMKYLVFVSSINTNVTTKEISKDSIFTNVSITFNASTGYELSFSSTDTLYSTTVYTQQ